MRKSSENNSWSGRKHTRPTWVLASEVTLRGGSPRRRQVDLAIAATALVEGAPLLTHDLGDFTIVEDLVDARLP